MNASPAQLKYLTTKEVADRFRISEETVRYWRKGGRGPKGTRLGGSVRYPVQEVELFERDPAAYNRARELEILIDLEDK